MWHSSRFDNVIVLETHMKTLHRFWLSRIDWMDVNENLRHFTTCSTQVAETL